MFTGQPQLSVCDTDSDGYSTFLLSDANAMVLDGLPPGLTVEYYATSNDAYSQTNVLGNNFSNTTPYQQVIYARVVNGPDCYGVVAVTLDVNSISTSGFADESFALCGNATLQLSAPAGFANYSWNTTPQQNTPTITIGNAGVYTVTVTDANGCYATKSFNITISDAPEFVSVDINDFSGYGNSVLINYNGNGSYEFSLDGDYYQTDPFFTGLLPGQYYVYIRDSNNCGDVGPIGILVLDNPAYFTPNGDGRNDFWYIPYLHRQPESRVHIYDRYGKLLYSFTGAGAGWDGRFNGREMPATDYWFVIDLEDDRTIKGHFALKR